MMSATPTCYMCDTSPTSKEHAPPLCFFPEEKEIRKKMRINLVRVPSCDLHNSQKSKDDEYFRALVLMSAAQHSDAAKHQFLRKILRAADRKPRAYQSFFTTQGSVNGGADQVLGVDRERFDICIDHLARALFFNTFRRKWSLPISVVSPNFYSAIASNRVVSHEPTSDAVEISRQYLKTAPVMGDNPEVFEYRLRYDEQQEAYAFAARFYECFEVYTYSSKEASNAAV